MPGKERPAASRLVIQRPQRRSLTIGILDVAAGCSCEPITEGGKRRSAPVVAGRPSASPLRGYAPALPATTTQERREKKLQQLSGILVVADQNERLTPDSLRHIMVYSKSWNGAERVSQ